MVLIGKSDMLAGLKDGPAAYTEFFRVSALSAGLYRLEAGAVDPQHPHNEDEIYFVLSGKGKVMVAGEAAEVAPGDFIHVAAGVDHRFLEITQTLELLVVFAPAET